MFEKWLRRILPALVPMALACNRPPLTPQECEVLRTIVEEWDRIERERPELSEAGGPYAPHPRDLFALKYERRCRP